jgi:hypothetical protein
LKSSQTNSLYEQYLIKIQQKLTNRLLPAKFQSAGIQEPILYFRLYHFNALVSQKLDNFIDIDDILLLQILNDHIESDERASPANSSTD